MKNLEYEQSFKVDDIQPYIDYCKQNGYESLGVVIQNRIVYENTNSKDIIARITTETINGKEKTFLDCKNVGERNKDLKVSYESVPLEVTSNNKEAILSILNVLNFYEAANNYRTRYIFQKNNVKFEIDDYKTPQTKIVAIEGEMSEVNVVYNEILRRINN